MIHDKLLPPRSVIFLPIIFLSPMSPMVCVLRLVFPFKNTSTLWGGAPIQGNHLKRKWLIYVEWMASGERGSLKQTCFSDPSRHSLDEGAVRRESITRCFDSLNECHCHSTTWPSIHNWRCVRRLLMILAGRHIEHQTTLWVIASIHWCVRASLDRSMSPSVQHFWEAWLYFLAECIAIWPNLHSYTCANTVRVVLIG